MIPPESILLSGANAEEILGSYNRAIGQLAPDVRQQLAAVVKKYSRSFGFDGAYERLNGKTVAFALANEFRRCVACGNLTLVKNDPFRVRNVRRRIAGFVQLSVGVAPVA